MKTCNKCKEHKPLTDFFKHAGMKDGVYNDCKSCQKERKQKWYKNNKEDHLRNVQHWKEENKEQVLKYQQQYNGDNRLYHNEHLRQYRADNPELVSEQSKSYYHKNKEVYRQNGARRRLIVKEATPIWAEQDDLRQIYKTAHNMTTETGVYYEVDHIIPLNNPTVCGLHCPANLRVILAVENRSKGNKIIHSVIPANGEQNE